MVRTFVPVILLAALAGGPLSAEPLNQRVGYHDLDLARPAGVRQLHRRVRAAAAHVCRFARGGDPMLMTENQRCRARAIAMTEPQIAHAIRGAENRTPNVQLASD